ncbi:type III secretion system protein [Desulfovibrio oxamicus]|uniref:Type III secretion system protein n=1 Tax=Nitratidesulfovibrio oxamicus TaxID=32016 RepID=A0ABS0J1P3_9BACT|nr:type III secretion system protein [Nitratidesulfovibrio oxamicus]MBG3876348.1 type III secretion system protein [Nitratidesulfovibrio oxamicus]
MSALTIGGVGAAGGVGRVAEDDMTLRRATTEGTLPPVGGETGAGAVGELPVLAPPPASAAALALETLMAAIGNAERRQACQNGVDQIKGKAAEQAKVNEEKLEQISKQLEEMRSKSVLNGFLKAFKIIGIIVGAIAAIATTAVGVATGNPLLIAAGVMAAAMTVDAILSEASGGKISFMAGMTELGKACGMDDETAKWFGFAMQMVVTAVSVGLSLGAGFANAGASAATMSSKAAETALNVASRAQQIAQFTSAGVAVGTGAGTVAGAVIDYKIASSQADSKELEAILERLRQAIDLDHEFLESEMKRAEELMNKVGEIVQENAEAQTAILSGAPAIA